MKIALAQINPTVGDVDGNLQRVLSAVRQAAATGAQLVICPELCLLGYPAKDLLLRREVIARNVSALQELGRRVAEEKLPAALVGFAEPNPARTGRPVFNAAALVDAEGVCGVWRKRLLPTYDVFDEARYFEPAGPQPVITWRGRRIGVNICEDLLAEDLVGRPLYDCDPTVDLAQAGADWIINISASPYTAVKHSWRRRVISGAARRVGRPIVYVNQVGGNDELLFDGASLCASPDGDITAQLKACAEDLLVIDMDAGGVGRKENVSEGPASVHDALVLGLRDYVRKCGFQRVVLGLSGGIDSALTAALAAEALGPAQVHGVAMPSRHSSEHSIADARALAEALGIKFSLVPIETVHAAYERLLSPHFEGRAADVAEENIQARIRGAILMALSNKFGGLLLTTGNKSELAVGYCTLYGDMCGGLAVISDVPKTLVYAVSRELNERAGRQLIPPGTLTKPPSAELRPNQTDQDTLPPYDVLDAILERYEEQVQSVDEIVAAGFDRAVVEDIVRRIHLNEYKRQQAAPGLKVTSRAFGFGRRMPIAARVPR